MSVVRKALLHFSVGAGYIITVLAVGAIVLALTGITLMDSLGEFAQGVGSGNVTAIGFSVLALIITGGLIAVWVKIRPRIAKIIGVTVKTTNFDTKRKIGFVFALLVVGVITSGVFFAFAEFTNNLVPGTNVTSLNVLFESLISFDPMLIVFSVVAIIFFGFLVGLLGNLINPIEHRLPSQLQK